MSETPEPTANEALERIRFRRFLALLMYDAETAGQKYSEIWDLLRMLFRAREHASPEDLADRAMDLLLRESEEVLIENFRAYAVALVRGLSANQWKSVKGRDEKAQQWKAAMLNAQKAGGSDGEKQEKGDSKRPHGPCYQSCLNKLSDKKRRLFAGYYETPPGEGEAKRARQKLAEELRITDKALRKRAFDLRRWLERCVEDCGNSAGNESAGGTI